MWSSIPYRTRLLSLLLIKCCTLMARTSLPNNGHCRHVWVEGRWCLAKLLSIPSYRQSFGAISKALWRHIWLHFSPTMAKSAHIRWPISTQDTYISPPNFGNIYWGCIWSFLTNNRWNIIGLKIEYIGCAPPYLESALIRALLCALRGVEKALKKICTPILFC